jgi:hypothetical protein
MSTLESFLLPAGPLLPSPWKCYVVQLILSPVEKLLAMIKPLAGPLHYLQHLLLFGFLHVSKPLMANMLSICVNCRFKPEVLKPIV